MNISARRADLMTKLKTITGLHVHDAWPEPANINPPCAIVWGPTSRALDTEDGGCTRNWEIALLVDGADRVKVRGQRALDAYLDESGDHSVIEAVEDSQIAVTGWADYGASDVGTETEMIGVRFSIEELA